MPSPWDLFLGKRLMNRGIRVVRIIHDATPHPGEVFPPKFWIKWLIRDCSNLITLSQYVSDQLNLNYGISTDKSPIPNFYISSKYYTGCNMGCYAYFTFMFNDTSCIQYSKITNFSKSIYKYPF